MSDRLARYERRRWFVCWSDGPYARPCWTYRGALRLARRRNKRNHPPGTFEVHGPSSRPR